MLIGKNIKNKLKMSSAGYKQFYAARKGIALIVTLFISVIVFILMGSLLLYTRREYQVSGAQLDTVKAQYAADAGVEYFIAKLHKELADNPSQYKLYYFPASNTDLYKPDKLELSATEVMPEDSPYRYTEPRVPNNYYKNVYGNCDDLEWRWVFRYTGDINNLMATDKELSPGQSFTIIARLKDGNDYTPADSGPMGVYPFLDRYTTWWQDHPYIINSVGKSGMDTQRTYNSEVRFFSQRKSSNFYYKVDY